VEKRDLKDFDNDSYEEVVVIEPKDEVDLEKVTPRELLIYFANRFKETQGFEYTVDWVKEMGIFKAYIERYKTDAGPMVRLLFDKYNCVLNGQVMTATAFAKGSKWIQDKLYIELHQDIIKESEPQPSVEGIMDSGSFLKRFSE